MFAGASSYHPSAVPLGIPHFFQIKLQSLASQPQTFVRRGRKPMVGCFSNSRCCSLRQTRVPMMSRICIISCSNAMFLETFLEQQSPEEKNARVGVYRSSRRIWRVSRCRRRRCYAPPLPRDVDVTAASKRCRAVANRSSVFIEIADAIAIGMRRAGNAKLQHVAGDSRHSKMVEGLVCEVQCRCCPIAGGATNAVFSSVFLLLRSTFRSPRSCQQGRHGR